MWIMISGPYTSGNATAEQRAHNLRQMNRAALEIFRRGHVPIIGVNLALPIIEVAGEHSYDELMMPIALAAAERCDACLRVGGPSKGADQEAEIFRSAGKQVFANLEDIPRAK